MTRMVTKKAKEKLKEEVKSKVRDKVVEARLKRKMSETPSQRLSEAVKQNRALKSSDKFAKEQGKKLIKRARDAGKSVRMKALGKTGRKAMRVLGRLSVGAEAALEATEKFHSNIKRKRRGFKPDPI